MFERFGVDYCCGGKTPLIEVCANGGVELNEVLEALREAEAHSPSDQEKDWSQESMSAPADHIPATHHAYLREELPRLLEMTEKVVAAHSERYPEVRSTSSQQVEQVFPERLIVVHAWLTRVRCGLYNAARKSFHDVACIVSVVACP